MTTPPPEGLVRCTGPCKKMTRARGMNKADYPGTVSRGAVGMCMACDTKALTAEAQRLGAPVTQLRLERKRTLTRDYKRADKAAKLAEEYDALKRGRKGPVRLIGLGKKLPVRI